jgi:hypothetical protein
MMEQMASGDFYYETRNLTVRAQDSTFGINWVIWGLFSGIIQARQIFIPGTGLLLTCAILLRLFVYGKSKELKSIDIFVIIGLVYIFTSFSLFPWSVFPFNKLNFIQLPWRLFLFSSFFFALAGGYYLSQAVKSEKRLFFAGCLVFLSTVFVMANEAKLYHEIRSIKSITEVAIFDNNYHMAGIEYVPVKVPSMKYIAQRGNSVGKRGENTKITDFARHKGVITFDISTSNNEKLELPLIYYKGYTAELSDKKLPVSGTENGLVQVDIEHSGHVKVYYGGTIVQKISWYITIVSIFALCVYIFVQNRKAKNGK